MPENRHPTLQVLRYGDMRTFVVARLFGVAARTGFHAAVVWHVTAATGDPIWLGVLGLVVVRYATFTPTQRSFHYWVVREGAQSTAEGVRPSLEAHRRTP